VNLTGWADPQGIHVQIACLWYRVVRLPVPVRKAGRLILVCPETATEAAQKSEGAGLCPRVSWRGHESGLGGQVAWLSAWAAEAGCGLRVARVQAGARVDGLRAKVRKLLPDPVVTIVAAGHRDRLGRVNIGLAAAALSAHDRCLVVLGNSEVSGDLVGDVAEVLTWLCARLCERRAARNRVWNALGCAGQDIGPGAVELQRAGCGV
jgi:putative resolvase